MMGVTNTGVLFKSSEVTTLSSIMLYMEMRNEGKVLNAAEHKIEIDDKNLKAWARRHNVEEESKLLTKENAEAAEGLAKAKRLFLNDFICVKRIVGFIHKVDNDDDEILRALRQALNEKKDPATVDNLKKQFRRMEAEKFEFDNTVTKKHLRELLERARKLVNGVYNACHGKFDAAFLIRNKMFFDSYLLTYFRLRWEARGLRKDLTRAKSFEEDMKRRHGQITKFFKQPEQFVKKVKGHEDKEALKKWLNNEVTSMKKDEDRLIKLLVDALVNALLLLTNSGLLVTKIVRILNDQEHEDIVLAEGFEIPKLVAEQDIQNKKAILESFRSSLGDVNIAINQLSSEL